MDNNNQLSTVKSGIPKERVQNIEKISVIEDLIKCSICLEILSNPYEDLSTLELQYQTCQVSIQMQVAL